MNENLTMPALQVESVRGNVHGRSAGGGNPAPRPASNVFARLFHDSAYLFMSLPVAVFSFSVLITGLSLAAGLLVTVIGIPVAVGTLALGSTFARHERWRLQVRGTPLDRALPHTCVERVRVPGLRGMIARLRDRHRWAEVLHGITMLPVADRVAGGGSVIDPEVAAQFFARRRFDDPIVTLTPREREVLALMAEGRSNAAIARHLVVSNGAVEKHIRSVLMKLDLPPADEDHRRVLAVLAWLRGSA